MADTKSLTGGLVVTSSWTYKKTDEFGDQEERVEHEIEYIWADGTADNQTKILFRDRRTLTLSTGTDDIDLFGALVDRFGDTLNFLKIRELVIHVVTKTSGEDVSVGPAPTNGWNGPWEDSGTPNDCENTIKPGGTVVFGAGVDGYDVAAGADTFRLTHRGTAGDITVDVILKGTQ